MSIVCGVSLSLGSKFGYWFQRTETGAHEGYESPLLSPWAHLIAEVTMCWNFYGWDGKQFCGLHGKTCPQTLFLFSQPTVLLPRTPGLSNSSACGVCYLFCLSPGMKLKFWIHGIAITFMATDYSINKTAWWWLHSRRKEKGKAGFYAKEVYRHNLL